MIGITPILSSLSSSSVPKLENFNEKRWTIMAYSSADSADEWGGILDCFASEVFSSDNIDVVLLEDTKNEPAKIWYVENNHSIRLLEDLGEISMGNYTTLRDFVNYCKDNFTSDRYILFFCGHGAGWRGACRDHGAGYRDDLTMDEMQKALMVAGSVDIVCFSGPCNMGSLESVYELRDCTDVYIASEAFSSYNIWRGTFNGLCILLNESSDISNAEVGKFIIQSIKEKTPINEYLSAF
ncbi:clostripain-related cysteine peptidase, partial [Dolichospermum sp. ST_sed5]|nr:clostripain-related cysteine peptidase [Dolichospermum sp. ST_sed5]